MPRAAALSMFLRSALVFALAALAPTPVSASSGLIEPHLMIAAGGPHGPQVALTLDACSGATDERILGTLITHRIAATIFATARWISRNKAAVAEINAHPDLFEIENHGARHLAAVDRPM